MARKNTGAEIAERYSEKIKAGLIQFKKTSHRFHAKTIQNFCLYSQGVVVNSKTNQITTLTYSESLKLREKDNGN